MAYSYQFNKDEIGKLAFARRESINASFKDLANVCANIRYRDANKAVEFLEQAAKGKRAIRYFDHNKKRGHLREVGSKKGGYPKKAAKIVLEVLKNAIANAQFKGLGECKIVHAVANKQEIYRRLSPKGRRIRHDLETAFVEIVLREKIIPDAKKEQKDKKDKTKQEQKKQQPQEKSTQNQEQQMQQQKPIQQKPIQQTSIQQTPIPQEQEQKQTQVQASEKKGSKESQPSESKRKKFSEVIGKRKGE